MLLWFVLMQVLERMWMNLPLSVISLLRRCLAWGLIPPCVCARSPLIPAPLWSQKTHFVQCLSICCNFQCKSSWMRNLCCPPLASFFWGKLIFFFSLCHSPPGGVRVTTCARLIPEGHSTLCECFHSMFTPKRLQELTEVHCQHPSRSCES